MFGNQVKSAVRVPQNESTEQAPTQTLVGMVKGEQYLIAFGDASGKRHEVVVVRFGDRWYIPGGTLDNAARWVRETKPVSGWLAKQLDEQFARSDKPVNVPSKDQVDVLGEGG